MQKEPVARRGRVACCLRTPTDPAAKRQARRTPKGSGRKPLLLVARPWWENRGAGAGQVCLFSFLGDLSIHPAAYLDTSQGKVLELPTSAARLPPSLPFRVVGKSRIAPAVGNPSPLGLAAHAASRGPES
jgi:hypothetical protein